MKLPSAIFATVLVFPIILLAEPRDAREIPTSVEAGATIALEMQTRQAQEVHRKAAIEAVPAFAEWEVDQGNRKTILRRVAPPPRVPQVRDDSQNQPSISETALAEGEARVVGQAVSRTLNLTAVVFDRSITEVTWRDDAQREWTILSNIDFNYLGGINSFEDEGKHWIVFLFVHNVDAEQEKETARLAAEKGFPYQAHRVNPLLSLAPSDFLINTEPGYIVFADEGAEVPAALYEELDALHRHYHAEKERLIADYERNQVLNEARRAWHEANPPKPKDTVINFWRVR